MAIVVIERLDLLTLQRPNAGRSERRATFALAWTILDSEGQYQWLSVLDLLDRSTHPTDLCGSTKSTLRLQGLNKTNLDTLNDFETR